MRLLAAPLAAALMLGLSVTSSPLASADGDDECMGNWDGGLCDPTDDPGTDPPAPEPPVVLNLAASSQTVTSGDDELCEELNDINGTSEDCETEESIEIDAAAEVTEEQLAADGELLSARGVSLSAAAASGRTIYYKTWKQTQRGLYYVNWKEEHRGLVYFDGVDVWIKAHRGFTGYHRCGYSSGIGYEVKVKYCTENFKQNSNGTLALQNWDIYEVHVIAKGIPLYKTYDMHANTYKTGTITFY